MPSPGEAGPRGPCRRALRSGRRCRADWPACRSVRSSQRRRRHERVPSAAGRCARTWLWRQQGSGSCLSPSQRMQYGRYYCQMAKCQSYIGQLTNNATFRTSPARESPVGHRASVDRESLHLAPGLRLSAWWASGGRRICRNTAEPWSAGHCRPVTPSSGWPSKGRAARLRARPVIVGPADSCFQTGDLPGQGARLAHVGVVGAVRKGAFRCGPPDLAIRGDWAASRRGAGVRGALGRAKSCGRGGVHIFFPVQITRPTTSISSRGTSRGG
jgi:hypothetical protein